MNKTRENCLILIISGFIAALGNVVASNVSFRDSFVGMSVIIGIAILALLLGTLPVLRRVYLMVIVTILGVFFSSSWFPFSDWVVKVTDKVQFMSIATTLLAYAGLSLAKDLPMFKRLSWRIVPVAMAVCVGTFFFAALIAQFFLKWEGSI